MVIIDAPIPRLRILEVKKKIMPNWKLVSLAAALAGTVTTPAFAAPEFDVRGRAHLDFGLVDADENNEIGSGSDLRRARLGVKGKLDDIWSFIAEYDFSGDGADAQDLNLSRNLGPGRLIIGQDKVPMGLNELTSSNNITFIERSSINNVVSPARRNGLGYHGSRGALTFQAMAFTNNLNDDNDGDEPLGLGGRVVYNPSIGDGRMLHLGVSAAYEDLGDAEQMRLRERPEARPNNGARVIDTGTIEGVESNIRFGLESAYQAGPFSAEAEYLYIGLDRDSGSDPEFSGFHLQASYVLTGESRSYGGGKFGSVKPSGSSGAWEVAARFSTVDLTDSGITGGEMDNVTLGLNYYLTPNLRFMANLIRADVDDGRFGDEDISIALFRTQYHF